jgi:low temperature requirement protein LtrA
MVDEPLWWRRPLLREDEDEMRRASWLELFVDLMFVAIISAVSRVLAADVSLLGVARYTLVFLPAWWVWLGLTVYNDRLDTDDVSHRLSFFAIMLALGGMAVSARGFFGEGFAVYAISYATARVVIILLWLRGGLHNPRLRPLVTRYAIGFSMAAALWLVAIALPWPARLWLVVLAIVIDFATPLTTMQLQNGLPRLSRSHLPERFGLFILIVLGESVISVEQAVGTDFLRGTLAHVTAGPAALALAFVLWWLYFDHVAENPPLPGALITLLWTYPHLALALALGTMGASIQAFVGNLAVDVPASMMLMCASVAVCYAMIGILEFMTEPSAERHHPARSLGVHGGSAVVAFALGFLGGTIAPLWIFTALVVLGALQIAYGLITRARHVVWDSAHEGAEG